MQHVALQRFRDVGLVSLHVLPLLVVLAASATGTDAGAIEAKALDPANAAYRIELTNAIPGQRVLTVFAVFEGGVGKYAFASARNFNAVSHKVDLSGVKLDKGALKGELKVTMLPDHWVPADHKPFPATYTVDVAVKDGVLTGTHKGRFGETTVEGTVGGIVAASAMPAPARARFDFFFPFDARPRGGRPTIILLTKDGVAWQSAFVDRPSSHTHGGNYGFMEKSDVRVERGVLSGRFSATHTGSDGVADTYDCAVNGFAILGNVGGTLSGKINGKDVTDWPFWGEYGTFTVAPPENAVYRIMLHKAMPKAHMVDLGLDAREGRFVSGVGVTTRDHASCDVDAQGLKLEKGHAKGRIKVTVNVDDWQPTDRKPIVSEYDVDFQLDGLLIKGAFTGKSEGTDMSGPITGRLEPIVTVKPPWGAWVRVAKGVKGLTGGFIGISVACDDKGVARLTHFPIAADVASQEFKLEGDRFTGVVEGKMKQGPYEGKQLTLKFGGRIVGEFGSGTMQVIVDHEKVDSETLFISVGSTTPQGVAK